MRGSIETQLMVNSSVQSRTLQKLVFSREHTGFISKWLSHSVMPWTHCITTSVLNRSSLWLKERVTPHIQVTSVEFVFSPGLYDAAQTWLCRHRQPKQLCKVWLWLTSCYMTVMRRNTEVFLSPLLHLDLLHNLRKLCSSGWRPSTAQTAVFWWCQTSPCFPVWECFPPWSSAVRWVW